jgi:hypothetical protein
MSTRPASFVSRLGRAAHSGLRSLCLCLLVPSEKQLLADIEAASECSLSAPLPNWAFDVLDSSE